MCIRDSGYISSITSAVEKMPVARPMCCGCTRITYTRSFWSISHGWGSNQKWAQAYDCEADSSQICFDLRFHSYLPFGGCGWCWLSISPFKQAAIIPATRSLGLFTFKGLLVPVSRFCLFKWRTERYHLTLTNSGCQDLYLRRPVNKEMAKILTGCGFSDIKITLGLCKLAPPWQRHRSKRLLCGISANFTLGNHSIELHHRQCF